MMASDTSGLRQELESLTAAKDEVLILDALDEAMVPIRQASGVLELWINRCLGHQPLLRIACRSTVWPNILTRALEQTYGRDGMLSIELLPLDRDDVKKVAEAEGINPDMFIAAIEEVRALPLAARPLTLRLLIDEFCADGFIHAGRRDELFNRAIHRLCSETDERRERGTARINNTGEYISLAEKVASIMLFSGYDMIATSSMAQPTTSMIRLEDLISLGLDIEKLWDLLATALFTSESAARCRFFHRQIAEYLAGRGLSRLPMHQVRAMLSRDGGHEAGVAGPLQEVAAWAASINPRIASWISEVDPELIGHSDVADEELRRTALNRVLRKFRNGLLTIRQLHEDDVFFVGFRYKNVEDDLKPILEERGSGLEDIQACAIELVVQWKLTELSEILTDIALDSTVSLFIRKRAAHTIAQLGDNNNKCRLKPLIYGVTEDDYDDLKGNALLCNWPERMTESELLSALTVPRKGNYFGTYKYFIWMLFGGKIERLQVSVEALRWAYTVGEEEHGENTLLKLAGDIAFRALDRISDPQILDLLARYLLHDNTKHERYFYLHATEGDNLDSNDILGIRKRFENDTALRRALIERLVIQSASELELFHAVRSVPGLLVLSDFPWLLEMAKRANGPTTARYAQLAAWLPWSDKDAYVEMCIELQSIPIIARHFPPLFVRLDSDAAARARELEQSLKMEGKDRGTASVSRTDQILNFLERCDKDPRWFGWLVRAMTLRSDGTQGRYERFITRTNWWLDADIKIRLRVVKAAKRLLVECADVARSIDRLSLSTIPGDGAASAFFLLVESETKYLSDIGEELWGVWAWYIIRELRFRLNNEPIDSKKKLMHLLHNKRPDVILQKIAELARKPNGDSTLESILESMEDIDDPNLDRLLCDLVQSRSVHGERLSQIMITSLRRSPQAGVQACTSRLSSKTRGGPGVPATRAAIALLREQPMGTWKQVLTFFRLRLDIAQHALGRLAYESGQGKDWYSFLDDEQIGQLLELLFLVFPPKDDPQQEGAHWAGLEDSARFMRDRLLSWLSGQGTPIALATLRRLEQELGRQYPWLKYPRAAAEHKARLLGWTPMETKEIAWAIDSENNRLLRSEDDLVELLRKALIHFQAKLSGSPPLVQNLWNTPKNSNPTPKEEEAVSDNLMNAIRDYTQDYFVTAGREVQLRRRLLAKSMGGNPGQKTDIFVEASGQVRGGRTLKVVIEVKSAHNTSCHKAMREQLVDRYLLQNGLTHGLYVLAYFNCDTKPYRSRWRSIENARNELQAQANSIMNERPGIHLTVLVIDSRLS